MLRHLGNEERGSALILTALMVTVIFSFAALALDIGNLYAQHAALANAVDAAALAGAQELPSDTGAAVARATEYASRNGVATADLTVSISDDQRIIEVAARRRVDYYFARLLGFQQDRIRERAVAKVGAVKSVNRGLVPFGVVHQDFIPGEQYTLKLGAGEGAHGNFGALAFGRTGANNFRDNLKYGYNGEIKVGDWVTTEPGNMAGPTRQGVNYRIDACTHLPRCTATHFNRDCPRVAVVPVIAGLDVNGRGEVQVIGFAAFFLEEVTDNGQDSIVTGRFVRTVGEGEIEDSVIDYGLIGVKLIE